jgi:vancomycin resistance protein YoaR
MNNKNKKTILIIATALLSIVFCSALSLFLYQKAYANKILANVYFEDINLAGKTRNQAKAIIESKTEPLLENTIIAKSQNDKEYRATFSQTGIIFNSDQTTLDAFTIGRDRKFFKTLFLLSKTVVTKQTIRPQISFSDNEYNDFLTQIEKNLNMSPVDASLSISNGQVIINNESNGSAVDSSGLKDQISKSILNKAPEKLIDIPVVPVVPTLSTVSLATAKTTAETYLSFSTTLNYNGQVYTINSSTISSWIAFGLQDGKYMVALNESAVKTYLGKIAAKTDISVVDKKISAVDNVTVLQEGRQGIYLNQDEAIKKIVSAITSNNSTSITLNQYTKDPQTITVFPDEGIVPGRFAGKYIDVDLTKQLLTLFDGSTQVGQFIVSTGKASMPTPTGTRTIQGRNSRAWSATYGLWMPWFMSIGNNYGIHELPEWPNGYKEGESHLGTPVSHGCIRLGVGSAETVYNWTPDGTPVYIHK